jgi:glycine dehydrogenase
MKLLKNLYNFSSRHIGNNILETESLLKRVGVKNINQLMKEVVPTNITQKMPHFNHLSETKALSNLKNIMDKNIIKKNLIGLDFHDAILPPVIQRNIIENPSWYTAYTPYQSEISQGRLEALFNFQTLITELTGLEITNSSLLDSGSSSAEALNMSYNIYNKSNKSNKGRTFFVDKNMNPVILDILKMRAKILDVNLIIDDANNININEDLFGFMFSYPNVLGEINQHKEIISSLKKNNTIVSCYTDLMSLMILKSPGELGADIAFGSSQRFGLPLGFGGPHSSFFATKKKHIRLLPGKLIGKSVNKDNKEVYRMALQTREQHIKQDKATSNICTSQALLSIITSMYAIYHRKDGLIKISNDIHLKTCLLAKYLNENDIQVYNTNFYDTLTFETKENNHIIEQLNDAGYNVLNDNSRIRLSINEDIDIPDLANIINIITNKNIHSDELQSIYEMESLNDDYLRGDYLRDDDFLQQNIFNSIYTETDLMRYIKNLERKDYSLTNGMIPLGSCTMKLNATSELMPLSWESVQKIHPYTSDINSKGYRQMIDELSDMLKKITGLNHISYQSNSGAMGEYSGLLCIQEYHKNLNQKKRNVCMIPLSAHGTNFASAKLAGMEIIKYSDDITLNEFEELAKENKDRLSCLMITYPNTYGIFDKDIKDITKIIHDNGGLVYMDGANMNAQIGITNPGFCGADVCHLNLHKTFCIPHGGGGPGMGPILVNDKLKNYLPSNLLQSCETDNDKNYGTITMSQWSSASILNITYQYLKMMGSDGLSDATKMAILNSNYLKDSLKDYYNVYKTNESGRIGHEFIITLDEFKHLNITDLDIAKRLIDYSFHSPTMSWPIRNSLMIEPTESESKKELDRFIDAMIQIRKEIQEIEDEKYCKKNNVLKNSPHSMDCIINWKYPYSIEKACFPLKSLHNNKFWPSTNRVNDIYGDKNLIIK